MIKEANNSAINVRYSELSKTSCCLSCGEALGHSKPQPGEICLDLGSGRGNDVIRMAESAGKDGFAYGIDISDGMLEKARKNAEKLDVKNVSFIKYTLESLPLESGSIDLVISNCTLNHSSDKQSVWNEIFRVLKNDGRFVVSDIYSMDTVPEKYANDSETIVECWAGSVTKEVYMNTLSKAGFKTVTVIEESEPYDKGEIKVSSFTIEGIKPS
ncbi:MAG: methyltransferase domain-containing protein [Spirochaetes bacterium]|nr:methyltransferase domain-containing protein [Spirochaetota bacterium]